MPALFISGPAASLFGISINFAVSVGKKEIINADCLFNIICHGFMRLVISKMEKLSI